MVAINIKNDGRSDKHGTISDIDTNVEMISKMECSTDPKKVIQSETTTAVRYFLRDEIGQGGFGQVVGAKMFVETKGEAAPHKWLDHGLCQQLNSRDVAIKIQPRHHPTDRHPERHTKRLKTECNLLQRFGHHPNIIGFVEAIDTPDRVYIVMEKASMDVYRMLKDHKKTVKAQPDFHQQVMRGLLAGLGYLHNAGIAHGDIKLTNILLQVQVLTNPNKATSSIKLKQVLSDSVTLG